MAIYICVKSLMREHFGEIVEKIADFLMTGKGPKRLHNIFRETGLPLQKVRLGLCSLIQHHMVDYQIKNRGYIEYFMDTDEVVKILRYGKYLFCVKNVFGTVGESIVKKLLLHGQLKATSIIKNVAQDMKDMTSAESYPIVRDTFVHMVNKRFICHVSCATEKVIVNEDNNKKKEKDISTSSYFREDLFQLPSIDLSKIDLPAGEINETIFWKVNFIKLDHCIRNEMIISAVKNTIDLNGSNVISSIIELTESFDPWVATSKSISTQDITHQLKDHPDICHNITQYLVLLTEDSSKILFKEADHQGGLFSVNWKQSVTELTKATIETIINERFGSDYLRIYRVIQQKKYIEQKQISELAMIPAKEAKILLYRLFAERFISTKEYSRTADHVPSRTIYLFYIDFPKLVTTLLDWCYKTIGNLIIRKETEYNINFKILEKEQAVNISIEQLIEKKADEDELKLAEDVLSPSEKDQLQKLRKFEHLIELAQTPVAETAFILELYMKYFKVKD